MSTPAETKRKWKQGAAGKESQKRYNDSEKAKAARRRYRLTAKGKRADKVYATSVAGKAAQKRGHARHQARFPERVKARNALNNAVKDGRILRQPCEICGARGEAHHADYSKPLDVRWFCRMHHLDEHK